LYYESESGLDNRIPPSFSWKVLTHTVLIDLKLANLPRSSAYTHGG